MQPTGPSGAPPVVGGEAESRARFEATYPDYARTASLEALGQSDFSHLDARRQVYLDATGAGPCAFEEHMRLLRTHVPGKPHSANPASRLATAFVQAARARVLAHFSASADEYAVVFTANATAALKLVAASSFGPGGGLLLTYDNHDSANPMRECAATRGAAVTCVPSTRPALRLDPLRLEAALAPRADGARLFAFPARSNFTGVRDPLFWIERAHALGWDVLLDAAAYAPTAALDLSRHHPDFVVLSLYTMSGHPTGAGALVARRAAFERLARHWYAGGTTVFSSGPTLHRQRHRAPPARRPRGRRGRHARSPGHPGGGHRPRPACRGRPRADQRPHAGPHRPAGRGAGLAPPRERHAGRAALRAARPGRPRRQRPVQHPQADRRAPGRHRGPGAAAAEGISVRSGYHCNPGGGEVALNDGPAAVVGCCAEPMALGAETPGHPDGALRASFGIASNFDDAYRLWRFAAGYRQ